MSNLITTAEHAAATALHDIVVGARAVQSYLNKAGTVIAKDAPTVEALTALVDPRAAAIERVGVALLGQAEPVIAGLAGDVENDAAAPSVKLTASLVADLRTIFASTKNEVTAAKAQIATV